MLSRGMILVCLTAGVMVAASAPTGLWTQPPTDSDDQIAEALPVGPLTLTAPSSTATRNGEINPNTDVDMHKVLIPKKSATLKARGINVKTTRLDGSPIHFVRLFDGQGNPINVLGSEGNGTAGITISPNLATNGGPLFIGVSSVGNNRYNQRDGNGDVPGTSVGRYLLTVTVLVGP